MPEHNIFAKKILLAETVAQGQFVSYSGHLATTGSGNKEPAGVARYDGVSGENIAVMTVGVIDVAHTALALGDPVKANAGNTEKATSEAEAIGHVSELLSDNLAEIHLK